MDIQWFRDLVISIFGVVASLVLVFLAVLAFSCYRQIKPLIDSAKTVSKTLEAVSARVEDEVLKPVIELVAFIRILYQFIEAVKRFFRKKGESDGPGGAK